MADSAFAELRDHMVRMQLERRGIHDEAVLAAMRRVPREMFVPPESRSEAYADRALPIGAGQTISQPYMVAVMTAALELGPASRVLEVGTGSGYQAAVLGSISRSVITIERHESLARTARQRLAPLGLEHVSVIVGDGTIGHPAGAPYDAILVTAGAPHVPAALREQLAEGGRLVIPVGDSFHQTLQVVRRAGNEWTTEMHEGCIFVPLVGADGWGE